jgi:histidine ammonia-lyase
MINKGVVPYVQEKGSLGVSGDLSPLSQFAEVAIGEGRAWYQGELLPGAEAMKRAGVEPTDLTYKEGLGLINGSQMMTAGAALLVYDAERVLKNALIASAMSADALRAVARAFDPHVHRVRPFAGQNAVAANLLRLFDGSEVMAHRTGRVQDGYSIRCTPQILGPSFDTIEHVRRIVNIEVNAAADNPLFFAEDGEYFAAGNFHGQGIGMVVDFLCIALSEVANLSERHTNRLLNPTLSGLPDFLVEGKGLNSGLMVAQYTAAALVSENKVLSHPASVDSISVSADQEDHVSMGPIAVRKCTEILKNVRTVLAIEMMAAAQAFEFHEGRRPGRGTAVAYNVIRTKVPRLVDDRVLHPDIEAIRQLVEDGAILEAVEAEIGPLKLARDVELPRPNVPV